MNKKVILMILDGWGKSPDPKVSAIDNANTPFIDSLYTKYPNAQLRTDGLNVGLPEGQMGNSEVGHMNLGAGRIVFQELQRINNACSSGEIKNEKVAECVLWLTYDMGETALSYNVYLPGNKLVSNRLQVSRGH